VLSQLNGIFQGYNAHGAKVHNISWLQFVMFQMEDELGDIQQSFRSEEDVARDPSMLSGIITSIICVFF
jgi:hypothetical protein